MRDEENELYLDFCEECFQMTNHLNGKCQKCEAKKKGTSRYDDLDDEDYDYKIK